jgi:phosphopantetheinyl transferase
LSFSHGKERLWAAMCSKGRVGIDMAYPEEFSAGYPFARAFRAEELDCARALCHNDTARGAALIWSVKEASVKATGAGFNRFDPLQVRVGAPLFMQEGFLFEVSADRSMTAWARTEDTGWLCVALT